MFRLLDLFDDLLDRLRTLGWKDATIVVLLLALIFSVYQGKQAQAKAAATKVVYENPATTTATTTAKREGTVVVKERIIRKMPWSVYMANNADEVARVFGDMQFAMEDITRETRTGPVETITATGATSRPVPEPLAPARSRFIGAGALLTPAGTVPMANVGLDIGRVQLGASAGYRSGVYSKLDINWRF